MKKYLNKLKGFGIGLCIAGVTAAASSAIPAVRGSCSGSCAQCGGCGLTALPLVLWLVSKRWKLEFKPGRLDKNRMTNPTEFSGSKTIQNGF